MGSFAALIGKKGEDVSGQLLKMMGASSPQVGDSYGFSTPNGVRVYSHLPDSLDLNSVVALGYKHVKSLPDDVPQPLCQYGYTMIFEGRIWTSRGTPEAQLAADALGRSPEQSLEKLIGEMDGSFAVTIARRNNIIIGVDPVGTLPLYIGESEDSAGAASNMKTLWSVGIEPKPMTPGDIVELSENGIRMRTVKRIAQPPIRSISMSDAVDALNSLLFDAVERRSTGLHAAPLGFSGGIDSTLLAYYLKRLGVKVALICVGVEGSSDLEEAERTADDLDLPFMAHAFPRAQVEDDLDEVLTSVEEPDPMKVSVALPLLWVSRIAVRRGFRVLFSGSGSDELFGGYLRYARVYSQERAKLAEVMFRDVTGAHSVNYGRDQKVCADQGVELRMPFTDPKLIEFGLGLPLELRIDAGEGKPRKPLLRALARRLNLPADVASRQKRAIQYSTGVSEVLKALARRSSQTLPNYLSKRFGVLRGKYYS